MSLIKYVSPSGWDWDRPVAVPLKWSSRGLVGADRQDFVKTAGHVFLPQLDNIKIAADEVPLHLIALGAFEHYGLNRNGDGFTKKACKDYHPTFVKFARFFRNHKNKPEKGHPHFGIIKASAWNEPMKRVELIVALNAEKSACDRNGGFVADQELEKLAADQDIPVSMACRVPYDNCTYCNNQAKTRKEYCDTAMCKAGGCKDNITRVVKVAGDMHHLGVLNHFPTWFDMSRVFRPADRIAWGAKADYLTKAAADHGVFEIADSIKMAEDDTAPLSVVMFQDGLPGSWNQRIAGQMKLAYAMAVIEEQEAQGSPEVYRAFSTDPFEVEKLGELGTEKCAQALGALADRKIVLNIRDFARLSGKSELAKEAADCLPGIYGRMKDSIDREIEQNPFPLSDKLASDRHRGIASLNSGEYSLDKEAVRTRSMLSAARMETAPNPKTTFEKSASDNYDADQLARQYAVYKLDALERIARSDADFPLTVRFSVRQNHVL
jgi:hypothetical protein